MGSGNAGGGNVSVVQTSLTVAIGMIVGGPVGVAVAAMLAPLANSILGAAGDLIAAPIRGKARAHEEKSYRKHTSRLEHVQDINLIEVARRAASLTKVHTPALPDPDWANRFVTYARDAMSSDARDLWAKVLAGKYDNNGPTSIHTLNIIRSLDSRLACQFTDACCVSWKTAGRILWPNADEHDPATRALMGVGLVDNLQLVRSMRDVRPGRGVQWEWPVVTYMNRTDTVVVGAKIASLLFHPAGEELFGVIRRDLTPRHDLGAMDKAVAPLTRVQ